MDRGKNRRTCRRRPRARRYRVSALLGRGYPIESARKTFFELQRERDRSPTDECTREQQLTRLRLNSLKLFAHARLDAHVEAAYRGRRSDHQ